MTQVLPLARGAPKSHRGVQGRVRGQREVTGWAGAGPKQAWLWAPGIPALGFSLGAVPGLLGRGGQ